MVRDPLTDPRPGDVVKPAIKHARSRCVEERFADIVRFWIPTRYTGKLRRTTLADWQNWCRKTRGIRS